MSQRKKSTSTSRGPAPERPRRAAPPVSKAGYVRPLARRRGSERRTVTIAILAVGVVIALGVMLASFGGLGTEFSPGQQPPQAAADAKAVDAQIATLTERVRQNPRDFASLVQLGNSYYDAKRWAEAVPWYEKALEVTPGNTDVRTDLGTAYLYSGNSDRAKAAWLKVLEQEPSKVQTHFNLGILYSGLTPPDNDSAAKEWETVIRLAPGTDDAKTAEQNLQKIGRR